MERALNLGMAQGFAIETPLMCLTKAETWALADRLGGEPLVDLDPRGQPHLLSRRARDPARLGLRLRRLPDACELRAKGWAEWAGGGGARHDLCGEGDLPHPAGRGRPGRPGRRCSAASPAATCGAGASRTAPPRSAISATPTSSGMDGPGGGRFATAEALAAAVEAAWAGGDGRPAGGLHRRRAACCSSTQPLIAALHGARLLHRGGDQRHDRGARRRSTGSASAPRPTRPLAQTSGQELKLVYPQPGVDPARFEGLDFERFYLQPMDGPDARREHPGGHRLLPCPPPLAFKRADTQVSGPALRISSSSQAPTKSSMNDPVFEITKAATFDAAHYLPVGPEGGRYRRMHGHSFRVEATVRGEARGRARLGGRPGRAGRGAERRGARARPRPAEREARAGEPDAGAPVPLFRQALRPQFPGLCRITLSRPTVGESCTLNI